MTSGSEDVMTSPKEVKVMIHVFLVWGWVRLEINLLDTQPFGGGISSVSMHEHMCVNVHVRACTPPMRS